MPTPTPPPQPPLAALLSVVLKTHTRDVHDRLDQHLLKQRIFASRERYLCFLRVQWHFHEAVASLDRSADAAAGRLQLIVHDLADLGARPPSAHGWRPSLHVASPAAALGWHYVAEGSTLGAAVLLKAAAALDLHGRYGARHLAPSPLGVAEYWRRARERLDAVALDSTGQSQACAGASDAFQFVRRCVDEEFSFE